MLIPSVDLSGGRLVKYGPGERLVATSERDPAEWVAELARVGEVAVFDLDAERGAGDNAELIVELCRLARCRVGGGMAAEGRVRRFVEAGAASVMVPVGHAELLSLLPPGRGILTVALGDERANGDGGSGEPAWLDRLDRYAAHAAGVLFVFRDRVGSRAGVDHHRVRALAQTSPLPVAIEGGVASVEDVVALDQVGVDAHVGAALLAGSLSSARAVADLIDFESVGGSVPAVVQDAADGTILALGLTTHESLVQSVEQAEPVLWSPHDRATHAGSEAGNGLELVRVELDCDRDAVRYWVAATRPACRRGTAGCFGERPFSLAALEAVIAERAASADETSYARQLMLDSVERRGKLLEEANQLIAATGPDAARGEAADLLFHLLVDLHARGVTLGDVVAELEARRRDRRAVQPAPTLLDRGNGRLELRSA